MKPLTNLSGVYQITCKPTGKIYVGSAVQFRRRWSLHRVQLRQGTHHSPHLQNAWNKHGADAFEFKVLLVCAPEMVVFYEQVMMDALKPSFNICPVAGSNIGMKHSDAAKENMRRSVRAARAKYDWKGKLCCLADIAELENIDVVLLTARVLTLGKTVAEAIEMGDSQMRQHEHAGKSQSLSAWARDIGVHVARLNHYIKQGMNIGEAIRAIDVTEKSLSLSEFCRLNDAKLTTVKSRVKKGMGVMEAITQPTAVTGLRRTMMEVA